MNTTKEWKVFGIKHTSNRVQVYSILHPTFLTKEEAENWVETASIAVIANGEYIIKKVIIRKQ